uniref:Uncharacterized protein n=1 Tax=Arundo donax TaxID=35708 RepID=A0A0A9EGR1_ARUDO
MRSQGRWFCRRRARTGGRLTLSWSIAVLIDRRQMKRGR